MSNKMSSKLAAGVRKVRERETAVPAKTKPAADRREETPTVKADLAMSGAALHPVRVWPD
jgi:ribosomal protein L44E